MKSFLIGVIRDSWIYSEISHNLLDNSTGFLLLCKVKGPLTQAVEYLPFKQRVAGSSPVRPTNETNGTLERWNDGFKIIFFKKIIYPLLHFSNIPLFHFFSRPHRLARPRTPAFHVGNRGSNPLGDAKLILRKPHFLLGLFYFLGQGHPRLCREATRVRSSWASSKEIPLGTPERKGSRIGYPFLHN